MPTLVLHLVSNVQLLKCLLYEQLIQRYFSILWMTRYVVKAMPINYMKYNKAEKQQNLFNQSQTVHIMPLVIHALRGRDTHTYIRTEVILRNQACGQCALGLNCCVGIRSLLQLAGGCC